MMRKKLRATFKVPTRSSECVVVEAADDEAGLVGASVQNLIPASSAIHVSLTTD